MEHEHEWRVTGPSGTLAQRVGDHVASANQLLQQSRRAVERLRARTELAHRRIDRTNRRIQEARGSVRALPRSSSDAMDRFLLVKERELTAHLAAVELHEQTAKLQDRMGHPQRAAEARTQAERARQWYRLANEELAEFEARFEGGGKAGPAA
jgi:chromosome segregation ATPase